MKKNNNDKNTIMEQSNYKRRYVDVAFHKIYEINFTEKGNDIYRPGMCRYYKGCLYIMDYSNMKIAQISFDKDIKSHKIAYIGMGKGQCPGEFINPTDMKIYKDKIYIADPFRATIEIYTLKNEYSGSINIPKSKSPLRITLYDNKIVVEPQSYMKGKMFCLCDIDGHVLNEYGSYYGENMQNPLINDNVVSNVINNDEYYYFPIARGIVGKYKNDTLMFTKYTVDGKRKTFEVLKKEIMKGMYGSKLESL